MLSVHGVREGSSFLSELKNIQNSYYGRTTLLKTGSLRWLCELETALKWQRGGAGRMRRTSFRPPSTVCWDQPFTSRSESSYLS